MRFLSSNSSTLASHIWTFRRNASISSSTPAEAGRGLKAGGTVISGPQSLTPGEFGAEPRKLDTGEVPSSRALSVRGTSSATRTSGLEARGGGTGGFLSDTPRRRRRLEGCHAFLAPFSSNGSTSSRTGSSTGGSSTGGSSTESMDEVSELSELGDCEGSWSSFDTRLSQSEAIRKAAMPESGQVVVVEGVDDGAARNLVVMRRMTGDPATQDAGLMSQLREDGGGFELGLLQRHAASLCVQVEATKSVGCSRATQM